MRVFSVFTIAALIFGCGQPGRPGGAGGGYCRACGAGGDAGAGGGGEAPPPPPPVCLKELDPGACSGLDYPMLEHRCGVEIASMCTGLLAAPTVHVLNEGQWDAACESPPPFSVPMGWAACDAGAPSPDVLIFCW